MCIIRKMLFDKDLIVLISEGLLTNRSGKGHKTANSERGTIPRKGSSKFNRTKSPK